jgi:hypothetical protein
VTRITPQSEEYVENVAAQIAVRLFYQPYPRLIRAIRVRFLALVFTSLESMPAAKKTILLFSRHRQRPEIPPRSRELS